MPLKLAKRKQKAGGLDTVPAQGVEAHSTPVEASATPVRLESLVTHGNELWSFLDHRLHDISAVENKAGAGNLSAKHIVFVAPVLPHVCELDLWNSTIRKLGFRATVVTRRSEEKAFNYYQSLCANHGFSLHLESKLLEGITDNPTFLAGLEDVLDDAHLVISVGESSLASYQALKARKRLQNRLLIWQTSPRPPHLSVGARSSTGEPQPHIARERTIRKEVLKSCDALLCFDKDSVTWAYLEDVSAQRLRRMTRGVNSRRFSSELNASRRLQLRAELGLPETDFIFLQAGPLEVEAGALDSVFAFKNLLQSSPSLLNHAKLVFCGTGTAAADVRQAVVDLKLDDHVYFINPNDPEVLQILGNQLSSLLSLCDAFIHNPLAPVNGNPLDFLDCTYDVLCAMMSGVTVVSNGHGWIGEWMTRFTKTFSSGSIHSQAKLMRDSIEKQDKLTAIKKSVRLSVEKEFSLEKASDELVTIIRGLMVKELSSEDRTVSVLFTQIDKAVQAKQYLDAIQLISKAFESPLLTNLQRAHLFRYIADCFTRLGDYNSGRENYLRALELDSYCSKSHIGLGTVFLQMSNFNQAVPHFQKAVLLNPADDMAYLGLCLAFEGLTELREALNWAQRACHMNIDNTAAIYHLVRLSYVLEEYASVEIILNRYIAEHPNDVNMTFTLAGIAFKTGKIELSAKLVENILALDPKNSLALDLLGQIQRKVTQEQKKAS